MKAVEANANLIGKGQGFAGAIVTVDHHAGDTDIAPAHIQGGAEYKNGTAPSISGLKVVDDRTIQITTTRQPQ